MLAIFCTQRSRLDASKLSAVQSLHTRAIDCQFLKSSKLTDFKIHCQTRVQYVMDNALKVLFLSLNIWTVSPCHNDLTSHFQWQQLCLLTFLKVFEATTYISDVVNEVRSSLNRSYWPPPVALLPADHDPFGRPASEDRAQERLSWSGGPEKVSAVCQSPLGGLPRIPPCLTLYRVDLRS